MHHSEVNGVELSVSRIVQGTMMLTMAEPESSFALLDAVFEAGINAFDTAHIYGGGDCERTLGAWIAERGLREKVVVLGKGAHHNADRRRVTPFDIAADLHDSLARLQMDRVDLYLLHRDDEDVPVGEVVQALHEQLKAGRIGAYGASNWRHERIAAANAYAEKQGLPPFVASSPHFSLAQQIEQPWPPGCLSISGPSQEAARAWYAQSQLPVFAWSSLSAGFFSGQWTADAIAAMPEDSEHLFIRCYRNEENLERLRRTERLAAVRGKTVPQVALAWLWHQGLNVFALTGGRSPAEVQTTAAALDIRLSPSECDWLDLKREAP